VRPSRRVGTDAADVAVGVLGGVRHEQSEADIDGSVREALPVFEAAGAENGEFSVPIHLDNQPVWNAISLKELAATVNSECVGHYAGGSYNTRFVDVDDPSTAHEYGLDVS
jgi:amidase